MSEDSYLERSLERFWGMSLGASRDLPNWLFLDGVEMMEIQAEVDGLHEAQLEEKERLSGHHN